MKIEKQEVSGEDDWINPVKLLNPDKKKKTGASMWSSSSMPPTLNSDIMVDGKEVIQYG